MFLLIILAVPIWADSPVPADRIDLRVDQGTVVDQGMVPIPQGPLPVPTAPDYAVVSPVKRYHIDTEIAAPSSPRNPPILPPSAPGDEFTYGFFDSIPLLQVVSGGAQVTVGFAVEESAVGPVSIDGAGLMLTW